MKNVSNKQNHDISFDEAKTVFAAELARLIPNSDNSAGEKRLILMGVSLQYSLLTVRHCERSSSAKPYPL